MTSSLNSSKITCIYCMESKPVNKFDREHVLPEAFGRFNNALVLHDIVCKDCNQYFGNTVDKILARGSMQGAIRYFRGIKPLKEFRDVDQARIQVAARVPGKSDYRQAEFIKTPNGEGVAFTPGIYYWSISSKKEQFVSLEILEKGKWNKSNDIDRQHKVIVSYSDDPKILERIKQSLAKLKLGIEILDIIEETKEGQRVTVVVDAIMEDIILNRAISKIAFNYLAYHMGRDFALKPILNNTRTFIRYGSESGKLVKNISQMKIAGDSEEAKRRRGHIVAIELAADNTTIEGFVEFFGAMTYKVILGKFGQLAIPISSGHYFDIISKQTIQMNSTRSLAKLWIPR